MVLRRTIPTRNRNVYNPFNGTTTEESSGILNEILSFEFPLASDIRAKWKKRLRYTAFLFLGAGLGCLATYNAKTGILTNAARTNLNSTFTNRSGPSNGGTSSPFTYTNFTHTTIINNGTIINTSNYTVINNTFTTYTNPPSVIKPLQQPKPETNTGTGLSVVAGPSNSTLEAKITSTSTPPTNTSKINLPTNVPYKVTSIQTNIPTYSSYQFTTNPSGGQPVPPAKPATKLTESYAPKTSNATSSKPMTTAKPAVIRTGGSNAPTTSTLTNIARAAAQQNTILRTNPSTLPTYNLTVLTNPTGSKPTPTAKPVTKATSSIYASSKTNLPSAASTLPLTKPATNTGTGLPVLASPSNHYALETRVLAPTLPTSTNKANLTTNASYAPFNAPSAITLTNIVKAAIQPTYDLKAPTNLSGSKPVPTAKPGTNPPKAASLSPKPDTFQKYVFLSNDASALSVPYGNLAPQQGLYFTTNSGSLNWSVAEPCKSTTMVTKSSAGQAGQKVPILEQTLISSNQRLEPMNESARFYYDVLTRNLFNIAASQQPDSYRVLMIEKQLEGFKFAISNSQRACTPNGYKGNVLDDPNARGGYSNAVRHAEQAVKAIFPNLQVRP